MRAKNVEFRPVKATDTPLLQEMTYEAAVAGFRNPPNYEEIMAREGTPSYFEDWGKPGDGGVVAITKRGRELGAAWRRIMPDRYRGITDSPSYTPDIIMALRREARGKHIGTRLLAELMDQSRERGVPRLSLHVIARNKPAVKLYEQAGFQVIHWGQAQLGDEEWPSLVMATWLDGRSEGA